MLSTRRAYHRTPTKGQRLDPPLPPPRTPLVPKLLGSEVTTCVVQAIAEMAMIKAQGDREQAMSEAEWKQLSNLIENDRRERVCPSLVGSELCVGFMAHLGHV